MRARNIKPSFFTNELLGTYDPIIQLLFAGLWCLADRDGRLEDRPLRIKGELFPYRDNLDINGYLTVLERDGFIFRYVVDGAGYIEVANFCKHQNPHHTEKAKGYPKKPEQNKYVSSECALTPLNNGEITVSERSDSLIPDSLIPDSLIPDSKSIAVAKAPATRGARLPDDWFLPKAWGEWALEQGWEIESIRLEADKFGDYWRSKAGKDACKRDWFATWKNWIRNAKKPPPLRSHQAQSFADTHTDKSWAEGL